MIVVQMKFFNIDQAYAAVGIHENCPWFWAFPPVIITKKDLYGILESVLKENIP